jgi:hypothetical protein
MANGLSEAAGGELVHEVVADAAADVFRCDERTVKEATARLSVGDQSSGLHLAQHGGHGGLGEIAFGFQLGMHLGHRGIRSIPERLEDAQLEVSEAMRRKLHSGMYDSGNITIVVNLSRKDIFSKSLSENGEGSCGWEILGWARRL